MNNKIALESLVMDLKRVAIGYNRNSLMMAKQFYKEALKRKDEIDTSNIKPYMKVLLKRIELLPKLPNDKIADESLMLSTLLQNYIQAFVS